MAVAFAQASEALAEATSEPASEPAPEPEALLVPMILRVPSEDVEQLADLVTLIDHHPLLQHADAALMYDGHTDALAEALARRGVAHDEVEADLVEVLRGWLEHLERMEQMEETSG